MTPTLGTPSPLVIGFAMAVTHFLKLAYPKMAKIQTISVAILAGLVGAMAEMYVPSYLLLVVQVIELSFTAPGLVGVYYRGMAKSK